MLDPTAWYCSVWKKNLTFAGGLAYGFAVHNDPVKAAQFANALGALRTQGKTFDVFKSKEDTEALISEYYDS